MVCARASTSIGTTGTCKFVLSGDEAIAAFEQQHVDLIVSDVRMPGMDGGQLLTVVKQRWPKTVRIIVSGYSDPVQAVRLTSLAHQYVAKPCDGQQLENIIERCFNLQELLSAEPVRKVVGRIGKLPAMPKTYGLLQAALAQPTVTAAADRRHRQRRRRDQPARFCKLPIPRSFDCASPWCASRTR